MYRNWYALSILNHLKDDLFSHFEIVKKWRLPLTPVNTILYFSYLSIYLFIFLSHFLSINTP